MFVIREGLYAHPVYIDIYWSLGSHTVVILVAAEMPWLQVHPLCQSVCQRAAVRWSGLVLVQLLAELFSGRSRDYWILSADTVLCGAGRGRHWVPGGPDAASGMAWQDCGVASPRWAARLYSQILLLLSRVPQTDYSFLMCSQRILLRLVVSRECWL